MSESVVLVRQKWDFDCAVAALNTIAPSLQYRDILRVLRTQIDPKQKGKLGLYLREVIALAARLNVDLTPRTATDRKLDRATGVLRLSWEPHTTRAKAFPGGHYVAIHRGRILDPGLGDDLPWREYQDKRKAQIGTLLELV